MARVIELTPRGRGAVGVLLVRGPDARAAVERLAGRALPEGGATPAPPRLVRLAVDGAVLDLALLVDRGAAGIELHVHGSPGLIQALSRALGEPARPPASIEDEAWELLARAPSEAAARVLLDQAEGALRRELGRLACAAPAAWRAGLFALERRGDVLERLVHPPRVVLAGPVNAGKSTLFNALLGRERVVESEEEGTTRDAIAEQVLLGGYAAVLVDTAGERALAAGGGLAAVEGAGQALARALRQEADLVLWLAPPGALDPPANGANAVRLPARGDLPGSEPGALRPREDPLAARRAVEAAFHAALCLPSDPWTPGAAVPLPGPCRRGLGALARLTATTERAASLAELLGPPPLGQGATPS